MKEAVLVRTARTLLVLLAGAGAACALAQSRDALAKVTEYCSVREASTQMMVEGRDRGIKKEQVLSHLPPLTESSNDAERATFSRLNDVYGMPRIGISTMAAHRFFGCILGAMDNKEPSFRPGLEDALLECQDMAGPAGDRTRCVGAALRKYQIR